MYKQLLFVSIFILFVSCTIQNKEQTVVKNPIFEVSDSLISGDFSVKIVSLSINDTLSTYNDGSEMGRLFSSPIITDQYLLFYHHNELIKIITPPIPQTKRQTIHNDSINMLKTPLYEICLIKSSQNKLFYYVNGADLCMGENCLEFSGLYSSKGEIIFQYFSNENTEESISDIFDKNKLRFNNWDTCIKIAGKKVYI